MKKYIKGIHVLAMVLALSCCASKPRLIITKDGRNILMTYFENGRVESSSEVVITGSDTTKQGAAIKYNEAGQIIAKKNFVSNNLFGPQWSYDDFGRLQYYLCYGIRDESLYFRSYNSEGKTLLVKGFPLYHIETDPGPHKMFTEISIKWYVADVPELKSTLHVNLNLVEQQSICEIKTMEIRSQNGIFEFAFVASKNGQYHVNWNLTTIDNFLQDTIQTKESFYYDILEP